MASRRTRTSAAARLFYGVRSGEDSDESLSDVSVSEDTIDDPDFVPIMEHAVGGDDNGDRSEMEADDGDGDGDDHHRSAVGDVGEGDEAIPSVSGEGADAMPSVSGLRVRGRSRDRSARAVSHKEQTKRGRTRVRGEWAHEKAKRLRNLGKEYFSYSTGKKIPARKIGEPCKDGCFAKLGVDVVEDVFKRFWEIGDYDKQNAYITQRVRSVPVKRKYTKSGQSSRVNYEYTVKHYDAVHKVCRRGFISIHGINEKRLHIHIQRVKVSPTGTGVDDKRGKAPNPKTVTGITLERVHEHIANLPTTSSHYTRAKSPHRRYLESGGTIKGLHSKYFSWMNENYPEEETVSTRYYEKVFTEQYNIGFQPPKKDTCGFCDATKVAIEEKKASELDASELETKLREHKEQAKMVQQLLSSQSDLVQSDSEESVRVIAMDLQQTLPCPRVSTGIAYYARKLWVYNFCIFDITKGKATMFVWDEVTGGRGSDEVASCLIKWLNLRQGEGEEIDVLRIFCDNCGGQNKNINIVLTALRLIHAKKLVRVEFVYMISGHSYLPCDRAFGNIEKKLRVAEEISTTQQYVAIIKSAVNPPFETIPMEREEFLDVKVLSKYVTKRPTAFPFSRASQLVVTFRYKEGYLIKTDYDFADLATNVTECRVMKTNRRYSPKLFNLADVPLPSKYPTERLLNPMKTKNLESILGFLGQTSKAWFQDLIQRQKELQGSNVQVSVADDEDVGSDSENDLLDYDDPARKAAAH